MAKAMPTMAMVEVTTNGDGESKVKTIWKTHATWSFSETMISASIAPVLVYSKNVNV
jgi:hypothetical protein